MTTPRTPWLLLAAALPLLLPADLRAQEELDRVAYSVHAGAGGAKAWNFVGATLEVFPVGDHLSVFATGGLGTILAGVGAAVYSDRAESGLFASATAGLAGAHVQAGGQLRLSPRVYAVGAGSFGSYFLQHTGFLPVLSLKYRW